MSFQNLHNHKFTLLTTYRKNGQAMPTPVWFAQEGDKLFVVTQHDAGKIKRIGNNPQVMVAPCTSSGKVLGDQAQGKARILDAASGKYADEVLNRKYGWQKAIFGLLWKVRGTSVAYVEITPV
ncbi:MAG: PPOX class F420-dependent oxidoreductase [Anaerolineae bacterium]|nr:PPOX class F420-dependent oxidoreductase [Anaerolineae bacterium]